MVDEVVFAQLLHLCPRITTLDDRLCGNHVSSVLLALIGQRCIDLECMRMANSNVVSVGGDATALAPVLRGCTHLRSIAIGLTTTTDDAVANMIARWHSGGALRECKLGSGHSSAGMRRLKQALGDSCEVAVVSEWGSY
jgi:hypothetical protein